jgi:hypothetical protein
MTADNYRYKLIKTWFLTLNKAGMDKEMGDDFLQSIYPAKSISRLTSDELYNVLYNLIKKTGLDIGIPKRPQKPHKKKAWNKHRDLDDRTELATPGQLDKIDIMSKKIGLSDNAILELMIKMGWKPGTQIGKIAAQSTIECLKAMIKKNWKPTRQQIEEKVPPGVLIN